MANKNTKAASRKAAAKQNPEQVPAEQPADIVPDQPQADPSRTAARLRTGSRFD